MKPLPNNLIKYIFNINTKSELISYVQLMVISDNWYWGELISNVCHPFVDTHVVQLSIDLNMSVCMIITLIEKFLPSDSNMVEVYYSEIYEFGPLVLFSRRMSNWIDLQLIMELWIWWCSLWHLFFWGSVLWWAVTWASCFDREIIGTAVLQLTFISFESDQHGFKPNLLGHPAK